jgi:hypothetical protein
MKVSGLLILSLLFWISGYLRVKVLDPSPDTELVYVPKWIFFLFGAPRHENIPSCVLPVGSVTLQTIGIVMVLYGILIDQRLVKDGNLSGLLGLFLSLVIGITFAQWLLRKQPYIWGN